MELDVKVFLDKITDEYGEQTALDIENNILAKMFETESVKANLLDAVVSLPIDWEKLKDKYDNECVEETGYGVTSNPDKRIVFLPDSMFEWFKKQITEAT